MPELNEFLKRDLAVMIGCVLVLIGAAARWVTARAGVRGGSGGVSTGIPGRGGTYRGENDMAKKDVADHLLERLRQWSVQHVFAYPGDGINGIGAAFGRVDNAPQFVQARHEEISAFEATGYA